MAKCHSEFGPELFDKFKPKPEPTQKAWPELQVCLLHCNLTKLAQCVAINISGQQHLEVLQ